MTPRLIGIKRKPCEVSQSLLHKPSLNSDIKSNFQTASSSEVQLNNLDYITI